MWGVLLHRLPFQLLWKQTKGAGDRGEGSERGEGGVNSGKVDKECVCVCVCGGGGMWSRGDKERDEKGEINSDGV